jgi:hypothetical protein
VKIIWGLALLIAGGLTVPAYAADTCILSQSQTGVENPAEATKPKITCVYSCPDGQKVSQTFNMQQHKTCAGTIPVPKPAPKKL